MFYAMFCFRVSPANGWKNVFSFWLAVKPLLSKNIETMYQHAAPGYYVRCAKEQST
jgi:hypothetical protein